ncbi:hypothetical protein ACLB2K_063537 [Fragaria x ananassa]
MVIAHAGDGNFHTVILFDPNKEEHRREAERLNHFMVHTALSMEGTCTGEHGVGTGKMKYLEEELGAEALKTMKRIKVALDPNNIMNPGKLIPSHDGEGVDLDEDSPGWLQASRGSRLRTPLLLPFYSGYGGEVSLSKFSKPSVANGKSEDMVYDPMAVMGCLCGDRRLRSVSGGQEIDDDDGDSLSVAVVTAAANWQDLGNHSDIGLGFPCDETSIGWTWLLSTHLKI